MIPEASLTIIKNYADQLLKPVRLVVFTGDACSRACTEAIELARAIKAGMGRVAVETYDMAMDRDKTEQYGIQRVPALVVQGGDGRTITFFGLPESMILEVLLDTIRAVSEGKSSLPESIRHSLKRFSDAVSVQVFVRSDCALCKSAAELAINFTLASDRIDTAVIMVKDFPQLAAKYAVTALPKTVFGGDEQVEGDIPEAEFFEKIFHAQGSKPGPDRRCLTCGSQSSDIICQQCKIRIRAEALDHKRKIEKQAETKPR
jgi:hypothetical protein